MFYRAILQEWKGLLKPNGVILFEIGYDQGEDLRKLIDDTTGPAAARKVGAIYDQAEAEGRAYLRAANAEIPELSGAERGAFEELAKPVTASVIARVEAKGIKAKQFYDELRAAVSAAK